MINVQDLHKRFGSNHVLRGLNFSVPKGSITGLVGRNGSGKSTTIRIITGFDEADRGQVLIDGQPMNINAIEPKRMIGYSAENAPSYREQTISEYLSFIALIRGIKRSDVKREVARCMHAFSLTSVANQAIDTLSKGYRHRTSLAQCLIADPPIIILDEPTDGLDPVQKIEARQMITSLAESKAILLTTHLLEEIDNLCNQVVVLDKGQITFNGSVDEAKRSNNSNHEIHLKVAQSDKERTKKILTDIQGLVSANYKASNNLVCAKLQFQCSDGSEEILDTLSLKLFENNIRTIELSHKGSSLANIFKDHE